MAEKRLKSLLTVVANWNWSPADSVCPWVNRPAEIACHLSTVKVGLAMGGAGDTSGVSALRFWRREVAPDSSQLQLYSQDVTG